MILQASKVLSAFVGAGFVPKEFTGVGPFDEEPGVSSSGLFLNPTPRIGAHRVLSWGFEPLNNRNEHEAAQAIINEVVAQSHGRVIQADQKVIGKSETHFAELRGSNRDGNRVAIQLAVFSLDGIVYRCLLSSIESKATDMRSAIEELVFAITK